MAREVTSKTVTTKKEVVRVDGKLKEITTVKDLKGKILHKIIQPLRVEFHLKDLLEVIIGASILAIPVALTEETWRLGETLRILNLIGFLVISFLFIGGFVYYTYYRKHIKEHWTKFIKRVFFTYIISFLVVGMLLTLIDKAPWTTDWLLALKRVIIVTFPASMSGTIADTLNKSG
ncbi:MAG: DUF2391 family protein [archaeon]|nr:TIGR02587 family membrane protein [Nanoarchaeota archaeon]